MGKEVMPTTRLAREEDLRAIKSLLLELADYHYKLDPFLYKERPGTKQNTWKFVEEKVKDKSAIVTEADGEIIGFLCFSIKESKPYLPTMAFSRYGRIDYIVVRQDWRGKGIGKRLISYALQLLKKRRVKVCEIYVNSNNPAKKLYQGLGFKTHLEVMYKKLT